MNLSIREVFFSFLFFFSLNFTFSQVETTNNSLSVSLKEKGQNIILSFKIPDGVDVYRLNQRVDRYNSQLNAGIICKVKQGKHVKLSFESINLNQSTRDKLLKSIAAIHHFDSFTIQM